MYAILAHSCSSSPKSLSSDSIYAVVLVAVCTYICLLGLLSSEEFGDWRVLSTSETKMV